jgi:DNA-directed RNA polymerase alpha subunit
MLTVKRLTLVFKNGYTQTLGDINLDDPAVRVLLKNTEDVIGGDLEFHDITCNPGTAHALGQLLLGATPAAPEDQPTVPLEKTWNPALERRVDSLKPRQRLSNCLQNGEYEYIYQLAEARLGDLSRIHNFGKTTERELEQLLHNVGVTVGQGVPNEFRRHFPNYQPTPLQMRVLNTRINEADLTERAKNVLQNAGHEHFVDVVGMTEVETAGLNDHHGWCIVMDLREFLKDCMLHLGMHIPEHVKQELAERRQRALQV